MDELNKKNQLSNKAYFYCGFDVDFDLDLDNLNLEL